MSTETYKIQNSQLKSPGGGGSSDVTTADISYYADGTDGYDGYDGLTVSTPKKTLQAVFDLIPFHVRNLVDVNLVGTFADDTAILDKHVYDGYFLNIDGGSGVTSVIGPYTSDSVAAVSIRTATSVTNFIYVGYWVKMTSGTNDGYIRAIPWQGSNYFYFNKEDMDDNNIGDTFYLVKPTTKLTSASSIKLACSGPGSVVTQRMHLDGGTKIWSEVADATIILTMLTADDSASGPAHSFENCRKVRFESRLYSDGSFSDTVNSAGVSVVGSPNNIMTVLTNVSDVSISGAHLSKVEFNSCGIGLINECAQFKRGINIVNSKSIGGDISEPYSFETTAGYYVSRVVNYYTGGNLDTLDGVFIINSDIGAKYLDIRESTTHAIELINSCLRVVTGGDIDGTGNTGAGVYAHSGSTMLIEADNTTFSITGTIGNFSTDGTTQKATWATIQGGTAQVDTNEMTICKEY